MSKPPAHEPGHDRAWFAAWLMQVCATRTRAAITVGIAVGIAALALVYGAGIHVDTRLESLLPENAPSLVALDELALRKGGSSDQLIVAVGSTDDVGRQQLLEGLAETIRSWPETQSVELGRDHTSLRDHALYLLDIEDLDELRDTLVEQRRESVAGAIAPGLGEGPGPDVGQVVVGEDDWDVVELDPALSPDAPAPAKENGAEPFAPEKKDEFELRKWLDEQKSVLAADGRLSEKEVEALWPAENEAGEVVWENTVTEPYLNSKGDVQLLKADLSRPPTDVSFARKVTEGIAQRAAELQSAGVAPDAEVRVVAAYNVSREINTILRDAKRATVISIVLVVMVLVIGLRGPRGLVLIAVPMGVAMALTLAVARGLYGELNALTVFLFAVLFGMGVDFAVHLYALRRVQGAVANWTEVVAGHLRPLASTMATTAASLFVLGAAEFKAFREFGTIAGTGVVICFVCALVLVPAVDVLMGPLRFGVEPRTRGKPDLGDPGDSADPAPASAGEPRSFKIVRIVVLVAIGAFSVWQAPKLEFEKDTRQLSIKSKKPTGKDAKRKNLAYGSAVGRCSKAIVLLADDAQGLDEAVETLQEEWTNKRLLPGRIVVPGKEAKPWVRHVYSVASLLPEGQPEKEKVLQAIGEQTNGFLAELPDLDDEAQSYQSHLEALEKLAAAAPLRAEGLPAWALEPFREKDGGYDRIALVCADVEAWHIDELTAMDERLRALLPRGVRHADSRLVFADLIQTMERDSKRLPLIALVVVLLFIALDLRRPWPTLACFVTLVLGLGLSVAVMGFWPIHLSFFNLVVMPAVAGLGIDASIHLWHVRKTKDLGPTGLATFLAALTTAAGFAGLIVAEHPGLRSIGVVGVLAVCACVGVAFLALYPLRR